MLVSSSFSGYSVIVSAIFLLATFHSFTCIRCLSDSRPVTFVFVCLSLHGGPDFCGDGCSGEMENMHHAFATGRSLVGGGAFYVETIDRISE